MITQLLQLLNWTGIRGKPFTPRGGFFIELTAGENLAEGEVVRASTVANDACVKAAAGEDMAIGVIYQAVSSGGKARVIVSGVANVLVLVTGGNNPASGNVIYCSGTAGQVDHAASLPAVAAHNREIGHLLESRTGAGLARAVVHFN